MRGAHTSANQAVILTLPPHPPLPPAASKQKPDSLTCAGRGRVGVVPAPRLPEGRDGGQNLCRSAFTHRRHFNRPAGSMGANVLPQISARSAGRGGQCGHTHSSRKAEKRLFAKLTHLKVCVPPRLLGFPKNIQTIHFKDNISQ